MDLVFASFLCLIGMLSWVAVLVMTSKQPKGKQSKHQNDKKLKTLIVLGSGGHTAEMMRLLGSLNPEIYTPRCYVLAATDTLGASKAADVEETHFRNQPASQAYSIEVIPRSREVGQSWITSFFTTAWACLWALRVVLMHRPDVVLCNGPGTCIPICLAACVVRIFGMGRGKIIFIESIARVRHLSLTGKILYHTRLATLFLVQWPRLVDHFPRARYVDRLM